MGLFNPVDKSINLKLVYYGPAFGGKTTNLQQVQAILDPGGSESLLSVNTGIDSTLFFDYLPLRFRLLDQYQVRVQGFTVPGQVQFDTTRRVVLKGCDGVIFVADSDPARQDANRASLENLAHSLRSLGMNPERVPVVLQFNKRDHPRAHPVEAMQRRLNLRGLPQFEATALVGAGVFETFRQALLLVIEQVHTEYGLEKRGLDLQTTVAAMEDALVGIRSRAPEDSDQTKKRHVVLVPGSAGGSTGSPGALLEDALLAGVELAALAGSMVEERNLLASRQSDLLETTQRTVHDLRKPLAALSNAIFLMAGGSAGNGGALSLAKEVVGHMGGLLDECAARLKQADSGTLLSREVDLDQVAQGVLRRMAGVAREQGVQLSIASELPRVRGSLEGLTSLISNLVGNGIKYHHQGTGKRFVELRGRPTRAGYLLGIRDNGLGIAAADRELVFSKYGRAEGRPGIQGTGLGLHIAREIARAHGGRLGLRSKPGVGSLLYLLIPAARLVAPSAAAAVGPPGCTLHPGPAPI
ncbi:MAG: ATP-binding protein [Planctomycetota bacterium]